MKHCSNYSCFFSKPKRIFDTCTTPSRSFTDEQLHFFLHLLPFHPFNLRNERMSPLCSLACVGSFKCPSRLPHSSDIKAMLSVKNSSVAGSYILVSMHKDVEKVTQWTVPFFGKPQKLCLVFFLGMFEITFHLYLETFLFSVVSAQQPPGARRHGQPCDSSSSSSGWHSRQLNGHAAHRLPQDTALA